MQTSTSGPLSTWSSTLKSMPAISSHPSENSASSKRRRAKSTSHTSSMMTPLINQPESLAWALRKVEFGHGKMSLISTSQTSQQLASKMTLGYLQRLSHDSLMRLALCLLNRRPEDQGANSTTYTQNRSSPRKPAKRGRRPKANSKSGKYRRAKQ